MLFLHTSEAWADNALLQSVAFRRWLLVQAISQLHYQTMPLHQYPG